MKLLPAMALVLLTATTLEPATPPDYVACLAPEIVERAHRFHGVSFSEQDVRGNRFFWRDGKRCKLFTEAFLKNDKAQKKN